MKNREFLFSYRFDGHEYSLPIKAANPAEAKARINALTFARYDGEVMFTGSMASLPVARFIVWVRNIWRTPE